MPAGQSPRRNLLLYYCGALRDLVPFVQFKKREKHTRKSVTVSKVAVFFSIGVFHVF